MAVAEELHFGRAAQRLHMAQPPLSQAVLHLERELDVVLIARNHHVVGLTGAGEVFLEHARSILADVDTASRAAQRAGRRETDQIRVGFVSDATSSVLPNALRDLSVRAPNVSVALVQATTGEQLTRLRNREIDVAVIRAPVAAHGLRYEHLVRELLVACVPAGHIVEDHADGLHLHDLFQDQWVLPTEHAAAGLRRDILAACRTAGFDPQIAHETAPLTAVVVLVAAGRGVALLPAGAARRLAIPGVTFRPLAGYAATTTGIAWRDDETAPAVLAFVQVLRDAAQADDAKCEIESSASVVNGARR